MKSKRERMVAILVRRAGGMRTMLLVGLIEMFPHRMYDDSGWFSPLHAELQKRLKIKPPVYWALLRGLQDRGLIEKRTTDEHGNEWRVDFGAIETYCKYSHVERIALWAKTLWSEIKKGLTPV